MAMTLLRRTLAECSYDFVCSLGSDCGCAWHLGNNGLRLASYPFDWIVSVGPGIAGVAKHIAEGMSDFCRLDALKRCDNQPEERGNPPHDWYDDLKFGYIFAHDFPQDQDPAIAYPEVKAKYDRRIARFYKSMEASRSVLLVRWSWREYTSEDDVRRAAEILRKRFPKTRIDFLIIRHVDRPDVASYVADDGLYFIDGPIHPANGNKAFGDLLLNQKIFKMIRLRGKVVRAVAGWLCRRYRLLRAVFIFDREKRRAYRKGGHSIEDNF